MKLGPTAFAAAASLVLATVPMQRAAADDKAITRIAIPNSTFPISQAVRVPAGAETYYFSGVTPPVANTEAPKDSIEAYGDTQGQATGAFERLQTAMQAQGLSLADVVMLHVYLVGDPSKDGKLDFAGMQAAYTKYFGSAQQPNKPARTTVQVAALAGPGLLIEVEAIAAKAP